MSRQAEEPVDPYRVLLWMCVIIAVNQLGFGALIPVLPLYAQSFGVSLSAIGLAIAVYGLARFAIAIPCGRMADQLGRRPTLAIGGLVSLVGNLWCALAPDFPLFLAGRFIAGAGASLVVTIGTVVLADISTPAQRGRMMATYQGTFLFAVGIGPYPGGLMAEHFGLAAPFYIYAAAAALVGLLAWWRVPETRAFAAGGGSPTRPAAMPWRAQMQMLTAKIGFLLVSLLGLVNATVRTGGLFNVVPLIGAVTLGLSAGQIGAGFALGSVLGLVASYPAGALADRYGRKPIIVPATMLTAASLVAFCVAPDYLWFVVACVVWGVSTAISGAAPAAYAADSAPPGMNAAAISSYRMLSDVGYVVGPISLGLLADLQGPQLTLAVSAAMLAAVGVAFAWYAPESYRPGKTG